MTRARDIADTQDNLGGAVAPFVAGKNCIINGGFDIWQRGTSFTIVNNNAYTADRFHVVATGTMTISRQTTGVPAGSQYCFRMTSGFTNSVADFFQYVETANVVPLQGKTVTYSIKMRKNAANTSDAILVVQKSATTDAGGGASWSTISSVTVASSLLPTGTGVADWYNASLTLTIPNDGTANSLRVYASTSAQIANTAYLELAQSQVELGSVATPFSRAGGSIGGELALCQRYFWQAFSNLSYASIAPTNYDNSGVALATVQFPVTMRIAPTLVATTGTGYFNWRAYNGSSVVNQSINSGFSTDISTTTACAFYKDSLTTFAGGSGRFIVGNSSATLGFSAEL
jgi:hypothetical protein